MRASDLKATSAEAYRPETRKTIKCSSFRGDGAAVLSLATLSIFTYSLFGSHIARPGAYFLNQKLSLRSQYVKTLILIISQL